MSTRFFSFTVILGALLSGCATPPPAPIAIGSNEYVLTVSERASSNSEGKDLLLRASELAANFCWSQQKTSISQILESETREAVDRYPAISRIRFSCRNDAVTNTNITDTSITNTSVTVTDVTNTNTSVTEARATQRKKTKKSVRKKI